MDRSALEGIRVIEFCQGAVGTSLCKQLADFGAEVIKIESRRRPDNHRGAIPERWNSSVTFAKHHRNKKDITINLMTPQGVEIAKRLVRISDIVVENFSLGVLVKWGLDYPNLKEVKPNIIMISLQGLGATGPHAHYVIYGPNLQAKYGMTYLWSHPDAKVPVGSHLAHPDQFAGIYGASALLAALDYRLRTGKGQYIDVAQIEAGAALLGHIYLDYFVNGRDQKPLGNRCPYAAPYGCYRCQGEDSWCVIAVYTDEEWRSFGHVLGDPSWAQDPKFATLLGRLQNVDELDQLVEAWTINLSPYEVMERLQRAGVVAGVVQTAEDIVHRDRQLGERGYLVEINHSVMGKVIFEGIPIKLSETPGTIRSPAPLLGEHTEFICRELLGMATAEIDDLVTEGILV